MSTQVSQVRILAILFLLKCVAFASMQIPDATISPMFGTQSSGSIGLWIGYDSVGYFKRLMVNDVLVNSDLSSVIPTNVNAANAVFLGEPCLCINMTDAFQDLFKPSPTKPVFPPPSYALIPIDFSDGIIEVDVAANPLGASAATRGFAGLVFRVNPSSNVGIINGTQFESVFLRMTNGQAQIPLPSPAQQGQAMQYVSGPSFDFSVLRTLAGFRYEAKANCASYQWVRLKLIIKGNYLCIIIIFAF